MASPVFLRAREVSLLHRDWWDFGFALMDAFPQALYYRRLDVVNDKEDRARSWGEEPPSVYPVMASHLLDAGLDPFDTAYMFFDPHWQPAYEKRTDVVILPPRGWRWEPTAHPLPSVSFRLGGNIYEEPVPHPLKGQISFCGENGNKEHLAMAARLFRLLGKFATNKKDLVRVSVPSMEVLGPLKDGYCPDWCGLHAIEWAREEPNRVLFYDKRGYGIRPTAEIKPLLSAPKKRKKA